MRKIIAILFLTVYLFSTTELHQVSKLPVVFEHYQEHKNGDQSLTFLQYLVRHYIESSPNDPDYIRDMQLPFKSSGYHVFAASLAYTPLTSDYSLQVPEHFIEQDEFIVRPQLLFSAYSANIWQPPKSC